MAIAHSQLLACYYKLAVFAISYKSWTAAWAHDYHRIGTEINRALIMVIMHIQIALLAIDDPELWTIDLSTRLWIQGKINTQDYERETCLIHL